MLTRPDGAAWSLILLNFVYLFVLLFLNLEGVELFLWEFEGQGKIGKGWSHFPCYYLSLEYLRCEYDFGCPKAYIVPGLLHKIVEILRVCQGCQLHGCGTCSLFVFLDVPSFLV